MFKISCKCCDAFCVVNTENILKRMEKHLQDVAQKVMVNNNLYSFTDHLAPDFTPKPTPQPFHEIMS